MCEKSQKRGGEILEIQDEVVEGGTEISEVFREILPRCCVRGQGRRLGGTGLCGCTYRRLDLLVTFRSQRKVTEKEVG